MSTVPVCLTTLSINSLYMVNFQWDWFGKIIAYQILAATLDCRQSVRQQCRETIRLRTASRVIINRNAAEGYPSMTLMSPNSKKAVYNNGQLTA